MENFCISFEKGDFSLESGAIAPNVPPQLCHWYFAVDKVDKPTIYVLIGSEADMIICKRADMIIHKCINA